MGGHALRYDEVLCHHVHTECAKRGTRFHIQGRVMSCAASTQKSVDGIPQMSGLHDSNPFGICPGHVSILGIRTVPTKTSRRGVATTSLRAKLPPRARSPSRQILL